MLRLLPRAAGALALTTLLAGNAGADTPPAHVRGTIAAVTSSTVDITTATGTVHLTIDKAKIGQVTPASRADIKPNSFVGIASVPGAVETAKEVVVFPENARGVGEGHYPWDLPGSKSAMTNGTVAPKSSMTNGSVMHGSSMTNGSVGMKSGGDGPLTLNVAYKGGTTKIVVPATAPIVTFHFSSAADLVVGAHVFAIASVVDGKPSAAQFVLVGKDGLVPPM